MLTILKCSEVTVVKEVQHHVVYSTNFKAPELACVPLEATKL